MNIKEAKELFLKYGCSLFHMSRADDHTYDYYKSFGITEEQESEWSKEYQQGLFDKIEKEDVQAEQFRIFLNNLADAITNNWDIEGIQFFLAMIRRKIFSGDSFTKVLSAESIYRTIDTFRRYNIPVEKKLMLEAKVLSIDILNNVINNPVTVAEHYRSCVSAEALKEQNIIERCKEDIGYWENANPSTKKKRKGKNKDVGGV